MMIRKIVKLTLIMSGLYTGAMGATTTNSYSHLMKIDSIDYSELVSSESKIYNSSGKEIPASELTGKYVGVFISASWCGPCRYFGKFLKKYAEKYDDKFAVILIGLDKKLKSHNAYLNSYENAFYSLAYDHRPHREIWDITKKAYGRPNGAVPLFVLFDENRKFAGFIRDEIMNDVKGTRTYTPWVK
jgi:thiol-disulfide isomerase/thioredoxin